MSGRTEIKQREGWGYPQCRERGVTSTAGRAAGFLDSLQGEGWRQGSCQRDQRKHALTSHAHFLMHAFISEGSNSTNYALTFIFPLLSREHLSELPSIGPQVPFAGGHSSVVGRHRRSRSPCPVITGSHARCRFARAREGGNLICPFRR